jgi:hypothetical protein
MYTTVDKIKLKPGVSCEQFEDWVVNRDYATCPQLKSLVKFHVTRVSSDPAAAFNYFEVIEVDSKSGFEEDMNSEAFKGLVSDFEKMADVVESFDGDKLGEGYLR